MKTHYLKNAVGFMESLKATGQPHTITLTNNTTVIEVMGAKFLSSDRRIDFGALSFIKQVKEHAESLNFPIVKMSGINYFRFFRKSEGLFDNAIEIDVNAAYWNIAHEKGYISDTIHEKGFTVDKMARLVALGTLATVKSVYHYDPGTDLYVHQGDIQNEATRSYFFDVSQHLGEIMLEVSRKVGHENIFFFWVDAFFASKNVQQEITELLDGFGLGVKVKEIEYIKTEKTRDGWHAEVKEGEKLKPFFFPSENSAKRIISRSKMDFLSKKWLKSDF